MTSYEVSVNNEEGVPIDENGYVKLFLEHWTCGCKKKAMNTYLSIHFFSPLGNLQSKTRVARLEGKHDVVIATNESGRWEITPK